MPSPQRRVDSRLTERLFAAPHRFEFFQALRLLLRRHGSGGGEGALGNAVRFCNSLSLSFPASEIEVIEREREEEGGPERVVITPAVIGLTGPLGVLPRHYTQALAEREVYARDTASRAFLDIFFTRAASLFFQAWFKSRLGLQYEADRRRRFLPMVLDLAGLDAPEQSRRRQGGAARGDVADESLACYAGMLRQRPQSAAACEGVLSDYFGVPCRLRQFAGGWFEVPPEEYTQLGGNNAGLGTTAFCGERLWDRLTRLQLVVGPLRRRQFDDLLPGGSAARALRTLLLALTGASYEYRITLVLDPRDIAPVTLGAAEGGARLGLNGWLLSRPETTPREDAGYVLCPL